MLTPIPFRSVPNWSGGGSMNMNRLVCRSVAPTVLCLLVAACAVDDGSDGDPNTIGAGAASGAGAAPAASVSSPAGNGAVANSAGNTGNTGNTPTGGSGAGAAANVDPTPMAAGATMNMEPATTPEPTVTVEPEATMEPDVPVGEGGSGGQMGSSGGMGGMMDTAMGGGAGGDPPMAEPEPDPVVMSEGPCDIYEAAGTPCVAAYSMVRRLASDYTGPLYQVRTGSNAQNTGSGGETHDIGLTADGFGDAAAQDELCAGTLCTISLLYDQSGHGNDLPVAKRGLSNGGALAAMDDFESVADDGPLTVGGHDVYSLYMDVQQGYRLTSEGDGVPLRQEPQGLYMVADGTHYGTQCCWDFGNVSPDPMRYGVMNTLFFGTAFWGNGAGNGPWFMADYEAGVWAGGSNPGDPGWGSLDGAHPANPNNPSLGVPFAIGFLKTNQTDWALRMADVQTANEVTTAFAGGLPKQMANEGAIVLGVGGDNSNNSWGTFFEGAVLAGFPPDDAEAAVLENVKAAGYGQ
jgi:hypothetical protein